MTNIRQNLIDQDVIQIDILHNAVYRFLGVDAAKIKILTETDNMQSIDDTKKQWFGDLNGAEIRKEITQIHKKESDLENYIWEFSQQLQLPDNVRMEFLQYLSDRLDYLALNFCPDIPRYAKIYRHAEEEYSAGVLTYTIKDNEPMMLLTKQADDNANEETAGLWNCIGGRAEAKDQFLHVTAARKVLEKSNKQILYSAGALLNNPFHDLITIKNNKPLVYRLYFCSSEHVDTSKLKDSKYSEYHWVKLSDLENGLKQKTLTHVNDKETVSIQSNGKTLTLYPDFYQALKQIVVEKDFFAPIKKGNPLPN